MSVAAQLDRRVGAWTAVLVAVLVGLGVAVAPAAPARADLSIRDKQWHLDYLHIAEAQKISTGQGVVVAVVDSGVQADHPDLAGQVDPGVDLYTNDGTAGLEDGDGHGTAMAGLIAAKGGGPTHASGAAPGARILPIRIFRVSDTSVDLISQGIRAAADRGAKVINLSLGADQAIPPQERDAVAYALAKNAVVVAAAGNISAGDTRVIMPAAIPGVIAVTGCDRQGQFWSGSAQGPEAVLCAPGPEIVSTDSPTGYRIGDGTSDATAIVSATVALVRARYPQLDAVNVINRLIRTADDAGPTGRDPQYGFGRVNPLRALTEQVAPVTTNPLGSPGGQPGTGTTAQATGSTTANASPAQPDGSTGILIAGTAGAIVVVIGAAVAYTRRGRRRNAGTAPQPTPPT